jgi:CDP-glucose 4,6-dehydratase
MAGSVFYQGRRVFITGHTGFKGTWLCRMLLSAGAEITGYALEPSSPSLFAQTKTGKELHSLMGDIRDGEKLLTAVREARPEIVFHLAAQPLVRRSYREPARTYEVNVMGTVYLLEALRLVPSVQSLVNVTTDKVYENKEWLWGYREHERIRGRDPYAGSKSCSELVTYSYRHSFFEGDGAPALSSARSGNVIGGGDYSEDRILPDCVRAASRGEEIRVRNARSVRPYQHVLECLSGYVLLAEKQYAHKKDYAGDYNFGPDERSCVTTGELADLFCSVWGTGASWREESGGGGPPEAGVLKLDCSKAKAVLGWQPRWDIAAAVEKTVAFARAASDAERLSCVENQIKEYAHHAAPF